MSSNVYLIAACRTPLSPRGGALKTTKSSEMAAVTAEACLSDAGLRKDQVDEVVVSSCLGVGGNLARRVVLRLGLNKTVAGLTIDRQCCGGLDALLIAESLIKSNRAQVVLAGGAESSSLRPACFRATSKGFSKEPIDQAPFTPWPERDPHMNDAADRLAKEMHIDKDQQDQWAVNSHIKAINNRLQLQQEIVKMKGIHLDNDEFTRNLNLDICRRAPRVRGSITAANMSVAADGAAMCLVVSEEFAQSLPRIGIVCGKTIGGDPELPGIAPVQAIRSVMDSSNLQVRDLSVVEIMEAYAVQAIACIQLTGIQPEYVNPAGGSLARGHPVGASGAVLAVRMFHELKNQPDKLGLTAIAAAGGLGTAVLFRSMA